MTKRAATLFAALGVMWGVPYLFIVIAVAEIAPGVIVFGRCLIGAAILLPFAARGGDLRAALRRWPWILGYACLEMTVAWLLVTNAQRHIASSLSGLLIASVPIFATVIALALRIERRIPLRRGLGLLTGLLGVTALVVLGGDGGPTPTWPILMMLGAALCYAFGPMVIEKRLRGVDPIAVNCLALAMATVMHTPLAIHSWPTSLPSRGALGSVALLGLFPTAIAFVLLFKLIDEVGPAPTTVVTYLNQVVALVAGVVFLREPITRGIVVGFPLILFGAFLATWRVRAARDGELTEVSG